MKRVVLDTNVLMSEIDIKQFEKCYVPLFVLEELDNHKMNGDGERAYKARRAIKKMKEANNIEYKIEATYSLPKHLQETKLDNKILGFAKDICTYDTEAVLYTLDYNMYLKAKSIDLPVFELPEDNNLEVYKGYKTLQGGTAFINEMFDDINKGINEYGFVTNEYLILYNSDLDNITEHRFDGKKFVDLRLPNSKVIKGLNSQQRCALDLLMNKDIPIKNIVGGFGSGKTMMSVKVGLNSVVDKEIYKTLMFIRNPLPADDADIGFLPGDKSEKIADYCRPFLQYVNNDKDQFYSDSLIRQEKIKMDVVSFLKGVSIDDAFVIMDEAEDLNLKLIKLVGSRIGKNSCIVFTGDWKQSEKKYKYDNGLVKLVNETKGNPLVGTVFLEEDVRSSASKVFADLL